MCYVPVLPAAVCDVNTYSSSGLEPCLPCPFGEYQPGAGQTGCLRCDAGTTRSQDQSCPGTVVYYPPITSSRHRNYLGMKTIHALGVFINI